MVLLDDVLFQGTRKNRKIRIEEKIESEGTTKRNVAEEKNTKDIVNTMISGLG